MLDFITRLKKRLFFTCAYARRVVKTKIENAGFVLSPEPLATLAGVYQDVRGQKPEELWRDAVSLWTRWLLEVIPDLLGSGQLRPLARASIGAFGGALDAV